MKFIANFLFYSSDCNKMSSIPSQSAFAAAKLRGRYSDLTVTRFDKKPVYEKQQREKKDLSLTPVKYNAKLINSIWNFYNL